MFTAKFLNNKNTKFFWSFFVFRWLLNLIDFDWFTVEKKARQMTRELKLFAIKVELMWRENQSNLHLVELIHFDGSDCSWKGVTSMILFDFILLSKLKHLRIEFSSLTHKNWQHRNEYQHTQSDQSHHFIKTKSKIFGFCFFSLQMQSLTK